MRGELEVVVDVVRAQASKEEVEGREGGRRKRELTVGVSSRVNHEQILVLFGSSSRSDPKQGDREGAESV